MNPTIFIVFALAIVGISSADEYRNYVMRAGEKCRMKLTIGEELYKELLSGASMPDEDRAKCFMSCFIRELGYYRDGRYNEEGVKKFLTMRWKDPMMVEKATRILSTCAEEVDAEEKDCNFAYRVVQCITRESQSDEMEMPIFVPN